MASTAKEKELASLHREKAKLDKAVEAVKDKIRKVAAEVEEEATHG